MKQYLRLAVHKPIQFAYRIQRFLIIVLRLLSLVAISHVTWASSVPAGFSDSLVVRPDGRAWEDAVGIAIADDGRTFVWERGGRVWLATGRPGNTVPVIDLSDEVSTIGSLGLIGFALDPHFDSNGYVYLHFAVDPQQLANCSSPPSGPPTCLPSFRAGQHASSGATIGRLVRYQLIRPRGAADYSLAASVNYASRRVLLGGAPEFTGAQVGCVVTDTAHGPGGLAFGSDGTLFVGCGDGADADAEDSGSDPATQYQSALTAGLMTPAENVGAFRAQLVNSLSGKILRLDPATGDGVAGNPFYDPTMPRSARSRVWVLGLHDPLHFSVRPGSGSAEIEDGRPGTLYIGDTGSSVWESLAVARQSRMNFGWPLYEGVGNGGTEYAQLPVFNLDAANPLFPGACRQQYFRFQDLISPDLLRASWPNPCQPSEGVPATDDVFVRDRPAIDWSHEGANARWAAVDDGGEPLALSLGTQSPTGALVAGPLFGGKESIGGVWYEGSTFPAPFRNVYFHADAGGEWIKAFSFDANDFPVIVRDFLSSGGAIRALASDPLSGNLLYVSGVAGSEVHKLSYLLTASEATALAQSSAAQPPSSSHVNTSLVVPATTVTRRDMAVPDTQAPTVPAGLASTSSTASSISLSWSASTDLPNPGGSGVGGYYLYRNGNTTTPIATITSGTSYTDSGLAASTAYTYQVAAFDNATPANVSAPSAPISVSTQAASVLGWSNGDIGTVAAAGSYSVVGGTYTVQGSGADIWNAADAFQFVSQPLSGDGSITARVVSQTDTDPWAKAGVMFRESLNPGSTYAFTLVSPGNGVDFQLRAVTGSTASLWSINGPGAVAPYWVRVVRAGNVFSSYASPDGNTWGLIGTTTISMASQAYVGLAVTSHDDGTLSTAVFDNVTITAAAPQVPDTQAPTVPAGLASTSSTASSISLSWSASTDLPNPGGSGVGGYYLYRNGNTTTPIATITSGTSYTDSGLAASTAYTYQVAAFDNATPANVSAPSAPISVSTQGQIAVTPQLAALTPAQSQQFIAALSPGDSATWTVDGVAGGNTTVGIITASGIYTAGSVAGMHAIVATSVANPSQIGAAAAAVTNLPGVYTYHNDIFRDGVNTQEYALTPGNVNTNTFGKLFSCGVDGAIYGQPLWVGSVPVNGAMHNVVFVATAHDSLYAFDADANPCVPLWQVSLIDTVHGATAGEITIPAGTSGYLVGLGYGDITPEVGVTGTPVIDPGTGTLYVVSKSMNSSGTNFYSRLHAIDVATGNEKMGAPIAIAGQYPGTGDGGSADTFNVRQQAQRSGLAFVNGTVYIAWASHEDAAPYYGWITAYQYSGSAFTQTAILNVSPNQYESGIWMGGGAPAADSSNNLYVLTGNGLFDATNSTAPNNDYGDSLLQLTGGLAISQYFTPSDQSSDQAGDHDFGSGGAAVLADLPDSTVPHILLAGGKDGNLYVFNRDNLGGLGDGHAVQVIPGHGIFATGAFWNGNYYIATAGGGMSAYQVDPSSSQFNLASVSTGTYGFPGASPAVSANGMSGGIVWGLDNSNYCTNQARGCGPALLHAYDALDVTHELWNSSMVAKDAAGNAVKFAVPTIANGKVYIGTRGNNTGGTLGSTTVAGELDVYGLISN